MRLLLPMDEKVAKGRVDLWKNTPLFKQAMTDAALMMKTRDLVMMESLDDTALPNAVDPDTHRSPVEKHQQIGPDAARCLMKSVFSGTMQLPSVPIFLLLDLSTRTAEFPLAHLSLSQSLAQPLYYCGLCESAEHKDWVEWYVKRQAAAGFVDGSLECPAGSQLPPADLPAEQKAERPPKPDLHVLCWAGDSVKLPEIVAQRWRAKAEYEAELTCLIESAGLEGQGRPSGPAETGGGDVAGAEAAPAAKRARIEERLSLSLADLPSFTHEVPLNSAKGNVALCLGVGPRLFLVNRAEAAMTLPEGLLLCGFFSGKWWHRAPAKGPEPEPNVDLLFHLSTADAKVLHNGKLRTLSALVNEQRAKAPADAKVAYHDLVEHPREGEPGYFCLNLKHQVYFQVKGLPAVKEEETEAADPGDLKVEQSHFASAVPLPCWKTQLTDLIWSLKWTQSKGLVPIRPQVLLMEEVVLPVGAAFELNRRDE